MRDNINNQKTMKLGGWDFSDEFWNKIISMSHDELLEFSKNNVAVTDPVTGKIISVPRSDFDESTVELVICQPVVSAEIVKEGSIQVPCGSCGIMVWLSPDSPIKPMKICNECAEARKKGHQSISE